MGGAARVRGDSVIRVAALVMLAATVSGCAHQPPIVKPEVVRVPVEVVREVDPKLLRVIEVERPVPAAKVNDRPAYTNGQVATMLDQCLRANDEHNADKREIARGQAAKKP